MGIQSDREPALPHSRFASFYAPLLAFALPMTAYLMTMARGLVWGDGIELAAVAATLGVAHPTGYPLFTLLGHVFTWIPAGTAYWNVAVLCAASVAGAALILFFLLRALGERLWAEAFPGPSSRAALALAGALAFAWAEGPWGSATLVEVYGFELLFQLGIAALAWRTIHARSVRAFRGMCLLFGLGMTHHMLTLIVAPFVAAAAVVLLTGRGEEKPADIKNFENTRETADRGHKNATENAGEGEGAGAGLAWGGFAKAWSRVLAPAAGCFILGLLPLAYLPIRASQSPALNWGDPSSWRQFKWTVSGGEFRQHRFLMERPGVPFSSETYWPFFFRRAGELARHTSGQIVAPSESDNPMWVLLFLAAATFAVVGFIRLWRRLRVFAIGLVLSLGACKFFLFTYNILDIRDYELGFFALSWLLIWTGMGELARWGAREWRRVGQAGRASRVALLVFVFPLAAFFFHYRSVDRSSHDVADLYAVRLLKPLPEDAILLTAGDNDIYSAWYLQEVEGFRRDVLVYGSNFILNEWYNEYFKERDLKGRKVRAVRGSPTTDVAFVEALRQNVIGPNLDRFRVFTTLNIPALQAVYSLDPVYELLSEQEYREAVKRGEFPPPPVLYRIVGLR